MNRKLSRGAIIVSEIFLIGYAISLIFPYIWLLNNSFKTVADFYKNIWNLPITWEFSNYVDALKETKMISYFMNSIIITIVATTIQIMLSSMTAYVLAKYKFRGHSIIFAMTVSKLLIPAVGTLAPMYIFMSKMHLFNTFGLILLYATGLGTNMLIFYAFFKGIPWSYAEAAFIDGAGDWTVFWKIMLPMARNAIAAVGIISAITIWNDYFMPSILLTNPKRQTVAVGLYQLQVQQQFSATWTTLFAAVIIATLPMIILYIVFQEKVRKGFRMGGLKG
ncbi:carbohydrate ABC transporter permease [Wukongibacter baidiensis]|uniref:carbohydrate ABC transporter permease n=1 Tax=Wukongibacter baidiensis TaxID=1723361 RepID=UPI003D7F5CBD